MYLAYDGIMMISMFCFDLIQQNVLKALQTDVNIAPGLMFLYTTLNVHTIMQLNSDFFDTFKST